MLNFTQIKTYSKEEINKYFINNGGGHNYRSPLVVSLYKKQPDIALYLLSLDVDVQCIEYNREDNVMMLPLVIAIQNGYIDIAHILLRRNAEANNYWYEGVDALMAAIDINNCKIKEYFELIKSESYNEFIKILIKHSNYRTINKALLYIAQYDLFELAQVFIGCDVDINSQSYFSDGSEGCYCELFLTENEAKELYPGLTALMVAARFGNRDIVNLLIEHNVNVHLSTFEMVIVDDSWRNDKTKLYRILNFGKLSNKTRNTMTALDFAKEFKHDEIVKILSE